MIFKRDIYAEAQDKLSQTPNQNHHTQLIASLSSLKMCFSI